MKIVPIVVIAASISFFGIACSRESLREEEVVVPESEKQVRAKDADQNVANPPAAPRSSDADVDLLDEKGEIEDSISLLAAHGLKTGSWTNFGDGWGGVSDFVKFERSDSSVGLPNHMSFYTYGEETQIDKYELIIKVSDQANAAQDIASFKEVASDLLEQLEIKFKLPARVSAQADPETVESNGEVFMVSFFQDDWPTGLGYTIALELEKSREK